MDLFPTTLTVHVIPAHNRSHQFKPFALLDGPHDAVHAGRPQRTNRVALSQPITVDELLDGRLVGTVVTCGPERMRFIQRPVVEDLLVDSTGRDEDESAHTGCPCCFDQPQSSHDVLFDELDRIAVPATKPAARMMQGGVDYRVTAVDERGFTPVCQLSGDPFDAVVDGPQSAPPPADRNVDVPRTDDIVVKGVREEGADAGGVLKDPAPAIVTNKFNERGVEHWVRIFTNEFDFRDRVDGSVRDHIWYALHRHGIEIPGPLRQVELHQAGPEVEAREEDARLAERLEALHYVDFLDDLPGDALKKLAAASRCRFYTEGEPVIEEGDHSTDLFIILSGEVIVSFTNDRGKFEEIGRLGATKFFGETGCITGETRSATISMATEGEFLVVESEAFRSVLKESPKLAEHMSKVIAARQVEVEGRQGLTDKDEPGGKPADLADRIRDFFGLT